MKKYLIGSQALKRLFPKFKRTPKDFDFLVEKKIPTVRTGILIEEYHENPILFKYLLDNNFSENGITADVLYTLKVSHIFWDIFWEKHMFDIVFLQENGAKLIKPLFDDLYKYWSVFHGENKRSDLEMSAEDFFNNALKTYNHDLLHTFINATPTYTKILKDGAEVEVDENKFNLLTHNEKLDLGREEVYVMAFERLFGRDYRVAYVWMLKKFIISHAPMWEALYLVQNYREMHKCKINYVEIIQAGLDKTENWQKI